MSVKGAIASSSATSHGTSEERSELRALVSNISGASAAAHCSVSSINSTTNNYERTSSSPVILSPETEKRSSLKYSKGPDLPGFRARHPTFFKLCLLGIIFCLLLLFKQIINRSNNGKEAERENSSGDSALNVYGKAAVATEVPVCSKIGREVLVDGGSAVDAAIAAALCVGSINSFSSGIGGGGFMLVWQPDGHAEAIDFRETAPELLPKAKLNSTAVKTTGLAVGVPGELRGFAAAHKKYGRLPWRRLVEPSVQINRFGFKVSATMQTRLDSSKDWITKTPEWSAVFAPGGKLLRQGDLVRRPSYAQTLQEIADHGPEAFYSGRIGSALVDTIAKHGGVMSMDDMRNYAPVIQDALRTEIMSGRFAGRRIVTAPPPTSGPAAAHMLQVLAEIYDDSSASRQPDNVKIDKPLFWHRLAEIMRFGFARRAELGDPAFLDPAGKEYRALLSREAAVRTRRQITDNMSHPPQYYGQSASAEDHGTTQVTVVDENGTAVSLLSTVNLIFGSQIMDETTGVILNNEMDDFSYPGFENFFGLPPSPANFMQNGKRPMSSCASLIVERVVDGSQKPRVELDLVIGASGGTRILSAVFAVAAQHYVLENGRSGVEGGISRAVRQPRIHDQLFPDYVEYESGMDGAILDGLRKRNRTLVELPRAGADHKGTVQAVARLASGRLEAVADERKGGGTAGY